MNRLLLIPLFCALCVCAGCSYSTDFVVVNSSSEPLHVTYTIAESGIDPLLTTGVGTPAILALTELSGREWRPLKPEEFSLDGATRTVSVLLPPNDGLLINRAGEWRSNSEEPSGLVIERIILSGVKGAVSVEGKDVFKRFVVVSKPLFSYGPPTQFILVY